MPADIEQIALVVDGARKPSHNIVCFQYDERNLLLRQFMCGRQASRAGADDYNSPIMDSSGHVLGCSLDVSQELCSPLLAGWCA